MESRHTQSRIVAPCCLVIASGPSLTAEDVAIWSVGRRVYAVNDTYKLCPDPDVLYACDEQWWGVHDTATRHIAQRWTTDEQAATKYNLNHIPGQHSGSARQYFDASGNGIVYGGNSGFQALNLAYAQGCRDAVLLGFDMGQDSPDGPSHFFGDHPPACDNPRPYRMWLDHWQRAAPEIAAAGMRVRNATRGGALNCFERV